MWITKIFLHLLIVLQALVFAQDATESPAEAQYATVTVFGPGLHSAESDWILLSVPRDDSVDPESIDSTQVPVEESETSTTFEVALSDGLWYLCRKDAFGDGGIGVTVTVGGEVIVDRSADSFGFSDYTPFIVGSAEGYVNVTAVLACDQYSAQLSWNLFLIEADRQLFNETGGIRCSQPNSQQPIDLILYNGIFLLELYDLAGDGLASSGSDVSPMITLIYEDSSDASTRAMEFYWDSFNGETNMTKPFSLGSESLAKSQLLLSYQCACDSAVCFVKVKVSTYWIRNCDGAGYLSMRLAPDNYILELSDSSGNGGINVTLLEVFGSEVLTLATDTGEQFSTTMRLDVTVGSLSEDSTLPPSNSPAASGGGDGGNGGDDGGSGGGCEGVFCPATGVYFGDDGYFETESCSFVGQKAVEGSQPPGNDEEYVLFISVDVEYADLKWSLINSKGQSVEIEDVPYGDPTSAAVSSPEETDNWLGETLDLTDESVASIVEGDPQNRFFNFFPTTPKPGPSSTSYTAKAEPTTTVVASAELTTSAASTGGKNNAKRWRRLQKPNDAGEYYVDLPPDVYFIERYDDFGDGGAWVRLSEYATGDSIFTLYPFHYFESDNSMFVIPDENSNSAWVAMQLHPGVTGTNWTVYDVKRGEATHVPYSTCLPWEDTSAPEYIDFVNAALDDTDSAYLCGQLYRSKDGVYVLVQAVEDPGDATDVTYDAGSVVLKGLHLYNASRSIDTYDGFREFAFDVDVGPEMDSLLGTDGLPWRAVSTITIGDHSNTFLFISTACDQDSSWSLIGPGETVERTVSCEDTSGLDLIEINDLSGPYALRRESTVGAGSVAVSVVDVSKNVVLYTSAEAAFEGTVEDELTFVLLHDDSFNSTLSSVEPSPTPTPTPTSTLNTTFDVVVVSNSSVQELYLYGVFDEEPAYRWDFDSSDSGQTSTATVSLEAGVYYISCKRFHHVYHGVYIDVRNVSTGVSLLPSYSSYVSQAAPDGALVFTVGMGNISAELIYTSINRGVVTESVASGVTSSTADVMLGDNPEFARLYGSYEQLVGIRFAGVKVPKDATIHSAQISFLSEANGEYDSRDPSFEFWGDKGLSYVHDDLLYSVSQRNVTEAHVRWVPGEWVGGRVYWSNDLRDIVSELLSDDDWISGSPLSFRARGSGIARASIPFEVDAMLIETMFFSFWAPKYAGRTWLLILYEAPPDPLLPSSPSDGNSLSSTSEETCESGENGCYVDGTCDCFVAGDVQMVGASCEIPVRVNTAQEQGGPYDIIAFVVNNATDDIHDTGVGCMYVRKYDTSGGPSCTLRGAIVRASALLRRHVSGMVAMVIVRADVTPVIYLQDQLPISFVSALNWFTDNRLQLIGSPFNETTSSTGVSATDWPDNLLGRPVIVAPYRNRHMLLDYGKVDISNLMFFGGNTEASGGSLYSYATLSVKDCVFSLCQSGERGGAIFSLFDFEIKSSLFYGNSAKVTGSAVSTISILDISDSTFEENSGEAAVSLGGGVISNSTFVSNRGYMTGGAIHVGAKSELYVEGCQFYNNSAYKGGAVCSPEESRHVYSEGCTYVGNRAHLGGAIFVSDTSSSSFDVFEENMAFSGGAIYIASGDLSLTGSIFSHNSASPSNALSLYTDRRSSSCGGAISVGPDWFSTSWEESVPVEVAYCVFEGNVDEIYTESVRDKQDRLHAAICSSLSYYLIDSEFVDLAEEDERYTDVAPRYANTDCPSRSDLNVAVYGSSSVCMMYLDGADEDEAYCLDLGIDGETFDTSGVRCDCVRRLSCSLEELQFAELNLIGKEEPTILPRIVKDARSSLEQELELFVYLHGCGELTWVLSDPYEIDDTVSGHSYNSSDIALGASSSLSDITSGRRSAGRDPTGDSGRDNGASVSGEVSGRRAPNAESGSDSDASGSGVRRATSDESGADAASSRSTNTTETTFAAPHINWVSIVETPSLVVNKHFCDAQADQPLRRDAPVHLSFNATGLQAGIRRALIDVSYTLLNPTTMVSKTESYALEVALTIETPLSTSLSVIRGPYLVTCASCPPSGDALTSDIVESGSLLTYYLDAKDLEALPISFDALDVEVSVATSTVDLAVVPSPVVDSAGAEVEGEYLVHFSAPYAPFRVLVVSKYLDLSNHVISETLMDKSFEVRCPELYRWDMSSETCVLVTQSEEDQVFDKPTIFAVILMSGLLLLVTLYMLKKKAHVAKRLLMKLMKDTVFVAVALVGDVADLVTDVLAFNAVYGDNSLEKYHVPYLVMLCVSLSISSVAIAVSIRVMYRMYRGTYDGGSHGNPFAIGPTKARIAPEIAGARPSMNDAIDAEPLNLQKETATRTSLVQINAHSILRNTYGETIDFSDYTCHDVELASEIKQIRHSIQRNYMKLLVMLLEDVPMLLLNMLVEVETAKSDSDSKLEVRLSMMLSCLIMGVKLTAVPAIRRLRTQLQTLLDYSTLNTGSQKPSKGKLSFSLPGSQKHGSSARDSGGKAKDVESAGKAAGKYALPLTAVAETRESVTKGIDPPKPHSAPPEIGGVSSDCSPQGGPNRVLLPPLSGVSTHNGSTSGARLQASAHTSPPSPHQPVRSDAGLR
eukprot:Rmarinus@m.17955